MDSQERAERIVETMLENDYFSEWLGVRLQELRPGHAVCTLKVRKEMLNGFGRCHGGVPFALADSTMAFAANAQGRLSYTTENCISFLQRVEEGDVLKATASENRVNDKHVEYIVRVEKEDGTEISRLQGTMYRTTQVFFAEENGGEAEEGA